MGSMWGSSRDCLDENPPLIRYYNQLSGTCIRDIHHRNLGTVLLILHMPYLIIQKEWHSCSDVHLHRAMGIVRKRH